MLNMDYSLAVTVATGDQPWLASPRAGVWRKPLAREHAEHGHATSIVRYEPGARFHAHDHPLGEEILVLAGTFSDHTGDYGAGTYLRNPPGFRHAPHSEDGCLLLVKLHQFQPDDTTHLAIETERAAWQDAAPGARYLPLHGFRDEQVVLVALAAGAPGIDHAHPGGEEIYVLSGAIRDADGSYPAGTWLRRPRGSRHAPEAIEDAVLWVKSGHLPA